MLENWPRIAKVFGIKSTSVEASPKHVSGYISELRLFGDKAISTEAPPYKRMRLLCYDNGGPILKVEIDKIIGSDPLFTNVRCGILNSAYNMSSSSFVSVQGLEEFSPENITEQVTRLLSKLHGRGFASVSSYYGCDEFRNAFLKQQQPAPLPPEN